MGTVTQKGKLVLPARRCTVCVQRRTTSFIRIEFIPTAGLLVSSVDFASTMMSAAELLERISTPGYWHEATVHPADSEFPRLGIEHHRRAGYSILCHQDESSIGFLAALRRPLSALTIAVNLGGQVIERWPPELFLPADAALDIAEHFFATGRQHSGFTWARINRFTRQHVHEGEGLNRPDIAGGSNS